MNDFSSECDQIRSFLRIWPHILKKSLLENFIFCAVKILERRVQAPVGHLQWRFLKIMVDEREIMIKIEISL